MYSYVGEQMAGVGRHQGGAADRRKQAAQGRTCLWALHVVARATGHVPGVDTGNCMVMMSL